MLEGEIGNLWRLSACISARRRAKGAAGWVAAWSIMFEEEVGLGLIVVGLVLVLAMLAVFAFEPLPWQAVLSFAIVAVLLVALEDKSVSTAVEICVGVMAVLAVGIVDAKKALEGVLNTGVPSVALQFIAPNGNEGMTVLLPVFGLKLGELNTLWVAQIWLPMSVAVIKVTSYNTPVVAMLVPVVQVWSRHDGFFW